MTYCAKTGASRLVLPGGELRLRPDRAEEKISVHKQQRREFEADRLRSERHTGFYDRRGRTKLLFSGFISPFNLERCRNVTIRDLSVDYIRTFHSEGVVRAAGPGWLDMEFPEEYVCDLSDGGLRFLDDEGTAYPFSSLLEFDAVKREPAFHVDDYWLAKHTIVARQQRGGLVRIFRDDLKAGIGNVMVFGAARRLNPGFTIRRASRSATSTFAIAGAWG